MRIHRDGYIQANEISVLLTPSAILRAERTGLTRNEALEQELAYLGLEVTGITRWRVDSEDPNRVRAYSEWVQPSRR